MTVTGRCLFQTGNDQKFLCREVGKLLLSPEYCIDYGTVQDCCGNLASGSVTIKEMKSWVLARSVRAGFTKGQNF